MLCGVIYTKGNCCNYSVPWLLRKGPETDHVAHSGGSPLPAEDNSRVDVTSVSLTEEYLRCYL